MVKAEEVVEAKKIDKQLKRIERHDNAWIDDLQNLALDELNSADEIEEEGVSRKLGMKKKIKKVKKEKKPAVS